MLTFGDEYIIDWLHSLQFFGTICFCTAIHTLARPKIFPNLTPIEKWTQSSFLVEGLMSPITVFVCIYSYKSKNVVLMAVVKCLMK